MNNYLVLFIVNLHLTLFLLEKWLLHIWQKKVFILKKIFYTILEEKSISKKEHPFLFMQLLGMFSTPYLLHSELKSQAIGVTGKDYFTENYVSVIYKWIDSVIEA